MYLFNDAVSLVKAIYCQNNKNYYVLENSQVIFVVFVENFMINSKKSHDSEMVHHTWNHLRTSVSSKHRPAGLMSVVHDTFRKHLT